MSRYFQSSYHGSNDYKKYRQERIGKTGNLQNTNQLRSYPTSRVSKQHSPLRTKVGQKQHLQTFGRLEDDQGLRQSSRHNSIHEPLIISQKTYPRKYNIENDSSLTYDSKVERYTKERLSKNLSSQLRNQDSNFRIEYEKESFNKEQNEYSRSYRTKQASFQTSEKLKYQNPDNFEDSIISRRRQLRQSCLEGNSQTNKIQRLYQNQKHLPQNKNVNDFGNQQLRNYDRYTNIEKKYQRPIPQRNQNVNKLTVSPYQSRNETIRQRIDLNQNRKSDWRREVNVNMSSNIQATNDYSSKYKTTQVTPEKSSMTPRDDRNASEQRRKSLIQKSQMLKQKLSKLNSSSNTKPVDNQESKENRCEKSEEQNMSLNYTPKRYPLGSYQSINQTTDNIERSVSKKLNFEQDSYLTQENQKYEYLGSKQNRQLNLKGLTNENGSSAIKKNTQVLPSRNYALSSSRGQSSGEGALKKITELNDRINSRLESILKNYS